MKTNIVNAGLKTLLLLSATITAWLVLAPLLVLAGGKTIHTNEWASLIGKLAVSGIFTLLVYVVWQSVDTLLRIEAQQERTAQAIETLSRQVEELNARFHPAVR